MSNKTHLPDEFFYDKSFEDYETVRCRKFSEEEIQKMLEKKLAALNDLRAIIDVNGAPLFSEEYLRGTFNLPEGH